MRLTIFRSLACLALLGCDGNGALPPARDMYEGDENITLDCVPNLDGRIEADEVPLVLDTPVAYLVSPPGVTRGVDVAGAMEGETRRWDWSVDLADDQLARLTAASTAGRWYERDFPPDAFVAPFDAAGTTHTISRRDDRALYLLGVASSQADPPSGRTLLVYDPPVELIRFPIEPGVAYTQTSRIEDAMLNGIPFASEDTYAVEVAAVGELALPSLSFTQAHQVRVRLDVAPALGDPTSLQQVNFFFECFGEVARAVSAVGEEDPNFTEASEVWRLGI